MQEATLSLIHTGAARGALPLHRLPLVFHRHLLCVLHLFLLFTLYAISYLCHYLLTSLNCKRIIHYIHPKVKGGGLIYTDHA